MSTRKFIETMLIAAVVVMTGHACTDAADPRLGETESNIDAPTNLVVVNVRSDRQDLSWTLAPGTNRHIILRGLAGPGSERTYTTCCIAPTNTFIANHLTPNTNYCWQVVALDANNARSVPSNEVCLTTPGVTLPDPPATVTATAISSSRINVDWTAVANATRYFINESVAGGPFTRVASVAGATLTLQRANLLASTEYCYTVQTETLEGISVPSSPAACDTTFVTGLEGYWKMDDKTGSVATDSSGLGRNATLTGAGFLNTNPKPPIDDDLSYLNVPSGGVGTTAAASGFRLTGAFSITFWANIPAATAQANFMGMRSAGSCGSGSGWQISQGASGLQFIGEAGQVKSWGQSIPTNTWTHVAVTFAGGAGGAMVLYLNGTQVATTTYTATNHLTGVGLQFGNFGGCAGGQTQIDEVQLLSRVLSSAEVGTFGQLPPAPTGLMVTENFSAVQRLAWTAPPGVTTKWRILRAEGAPASGNETFYTHAPNPPATFNADHLTPSTEYAWQVQAVQNGLISPPSNEVVATTLGPPAAPQNVTATAISSSRITIAWDAVTGANKYFIQQSLDGVNFVAAGTVLAPATSFTKANLTANTTYFYRVQAEDATLTKGPFSAVVSATTLP